MSDQFDCQACGRCCFGQRDYVRVFEHDAALLGEELTARLVAPAVSQSEATPGRPSEPVRFMRMVDGHCIALERSASGRYSCGIYEVRPTLCRALESGTSACLEARAAGGLPAPEKAPGK